MGCIMRAHRIEAMPVKVGAFTITSADEAVLGHLQELRNLHSPGCGPSVYYVTTLQKKTQANSAQKSDDRENLGNTGRTVRVDTGTNG